MKSILISNALTKILLKISGDWKKNSVLIMNGEIPIKNKIKCEMNCKDGSLPPNSEMLMPYNRKPSEDKKSMLKNRIKFLTSIISLLLKSIKIINAM